MSSVHANAQRGQTTKRTLAFCACLLAASLLLAGDMAMRKKDQVLGRRVHLAGSTISIRPPKRLAPVGGSQLASPGVAQFFHGLWSPYRRVVLAAWRIDDAGAASAVAICAAILGASGPDDHRIDAESRSFFAVKSVGSLNAFERRHADEKRIVRVAAIDDGQWIAIELTVEDATIDDVVYEAFDLSCRSLEIASP